jgi:hypothetical protein
MIIEAIRAIQLSRYRNFGSDAVAAPEQELVERINVAEAAIDGLTSGRGNCGTTVTIVKSGNRLCAHWMP